MARDNRPCCIQTVEKWYRSFLAVRGGHHSEVMTEYFLEANRDLAPLFADILGAAEFRVAASKSIGQARMQPLACPTCGTHVALVILGSPFMLLLFRLQVIYHSMIESWEIIPQGPDQYRERIKTREPGDFQLRQLRLGLEMYLGKRDISHEGMLELLAPLDRGSPESKHVFLEAMRVAESWGVAHEFFHACIASEDHEAFPHFAPLAEINKDALTFANSFCDQVCAANKLHPDVGRRWLEEFQADLMASKMLLIGIADRRHRDIKTPQCSQSDARFQAARVVLNGAAAALDAICWVDVQRGSPAMPETVLSSSHPPHHLRWKVIALYVKAIAGLDDTVLHSTEVLAALSESLSATHLSAVEQRES
jgi:hypothetical protein